MGNPYDLLMKYNIPTTLSNEEIAASNAFDFRMEYQGAGSAVKPYEVGLFNDLKARSVVGDELDIHHVAQKQPAAQLIPGYNAQTALSIAVPRQMHMEIPTMRGTFSGNPRDLLAQDIRNLRNYTDAPNSALQELINLNKMTYPNAFAK